MAVSETLRRLNPAVNIVTARYGHIDAAPVELPRIALVHSHDAHEHEHHDHAHEHHDHDTHEHHHNHAESELGFTSWNTDLAEPCTADALQAVLDAVVKGKFGDIVRMKGLAKSGNGWLHFDVAGGRASMTAFAAGAGETARVVAIGRSINETTLQAAFAACGTKLAA